MIVSTTFGIVTITHGPAFYQNTFQIVTQEAQTREQINTICAAAGYHPGGYGPITGWTEKKNEDGTWTSRWYMNKSCN